MKTTPKAPAPAATTWQIDPAHSNVEFAVRHLMISTVKGRFGDVRGMVTMDEADATRGAVDVTIETASIDTRVEQRDQHLRSSDFFDVEHFPTITYRSRRVEADAHGGLSVVGDLTIRGTTREVALAVTPEGRGPDPWGGERAAFSAVAKINRRDFGLTWNQLLETGGVAVSDEVKISLDVELVRQVAPAAA